MPELAVRPAAVPACLMAHCGPPAACGCPVLEGDRLVDSPESLPRRVVRPVVITVPEEIDVSNAACVSEQLCSALRCGATVVIANMSRTRFCDSSGVAALVQASKQAAAGHAELRLAVQSGTVLRILQLLKADQVLAVFPSLGAALAGSPRTGPASARQ